MHGGRGFVDDECRRRRRQFSAISVSSIYFFGNFRDEAVLLYGGKQSQALQASNVGLM